MPVGNEIANCTSHVDTLFNCLTPHHQSSHYYRLGTYDTCQRIRSNLWQCMRAKVISDEHRAREIVQKIEILDGSKLENSPTKDVIWTFKEKGSWEE